jgi:hypothetical protein
LETRKKLESLQRREEKKKLVVMIVAAEVGIRKKLKFTKERRK